MPQSNCISSSLSLFSNKKKNILLFIISTSTLVVVSRYFIRKYYNLCLPCFVFKKWKFAITQNMSSSANARRPPSFEGWEVDLVKELNNTVDLRALSRDMPRLKVASPSKFSVKHEAWKLNQDQEKQRENKETDETAGDDKQFYAQLEDKADRMCAALLHLEDLITTAQNERTKNNKIRNKNRNAPDANDDEDDNNNDESSENVNNNEVPSASPLRKKSLELFPKFSKDADLSLAFTSLLRNTGWLPSEEKEDETFQATGLRKGTLPCDQLLPQVRILGTMAQTVIFAPSQRMAHLLWNPTFAKHLMDVDWEVFLMDHPWPENGMKKSSAANNNSKKIAGAKPNKKLPNEKSPLLAKNDQNDQDDDEEDRNKSHHNEINASSSDHHQRPETPATQIQVRPSSTSPQPGNGNDKNSDDDDFFSDPDPDHGEIVYVCHRIIARNVVAPEFVNRHPRFQLHWVLEIHCGKHTGVIKRTRIAGVRVRIMDDEAAVDAASSCCCGGASEWREFKGLLATQVEENFGVELEKNGDSDPF